MEFHLPEVYEGAQLVALNREKEAFLSHYLTLEKQKFLQAVTAEFKAQPDLRELSFYTVCEGRELDVEPVFAPEFDVEEALNYFESQSVVNALRSTYVLELEQFCEGRTIKRSDLLTDAGEPRFARIDEALRSME